MFWGKEKKAKGKEEDRSKEKKKDEKSDKEKLEEKPRFKMKIDFRRDFIGKVWFRLDYYDKRLMKLDDDKQKTFLDSYMESARQLNRSLIWIVFLMIVAYIIYAIQVFNIAETAAAWIILLYLLFYLAKRHRNENEKLLQHLLDSEVTPDYAKK